MAVHHRPFRFGVAVGQMRTRTALVDHARKAEALGYSTIWMGDHISWGGLATIPALMAAADATTTLRLACHVFTNDLRNPVILAADLATLDVLSDGRLEFGLGGGWFASDYQAVGVRFDPAPARVRRLAEAVRLIKRLWGEDSVTVDGEHYQIRNMSLSPKPVQQPHPPIFIGGGGKQILTLATQEADIVGIDFRGTPAGGKDMAASADAVLDQQIGWIRAAAGERMPHFDLHLLSFLTVVTDSQRAAADQLAAMFATWPAEIIANVPNAEQILASRQALIGSVDQIVEKLVALRECYGINYVSVGDEVIESFSPVVARLAGR